MWQSEQKVIVDNANAKMSAYLRQGLALPRRGSKKPVRTKGVGGRLAKIWWRDRHRDLGEAPRICKGDDLSFANAYLP